MDRFDIFIKNRTLAPRHHAHDRLERGGLAGAVAAEQRDHLTLAHLEIDTMEDVRLAVPGVEAPYLEQNLRHRGMPPSLAGRMIRSHSRPRRGSRRAVKP